ncbi:beta-glucoside-specific PTS transporter subunit IIABC [Vagococcus carniphilus]|uniref:beta-glucoside-specific PTS transporter subunit IIABC n=1 Tax=Vagococcus carniphilus TaxID=218144 RepID=UPI002890B34C|nr:beta-glucoside-specific PTS transporter subunit IIABC [Vagococcus carniphilus]MDT2815231.1 beta-glucoside-specific PTS transporter subunit IIABC [Vagococcus carniphilus]MDT2866030.1 beta-glucoside-specific PTS transporter subunit IIABC [Vagococcus carniphilus]
MKYQDFCNDIIDKVGGKKNIKAVVHCMTRLRFTLVDREKADTEALKEMDGVIDVVSNKVAYQIIIGTHVKDVYKELIDILGITSEETVVKEKRNPIKSILDVVSESMNPILEPIICAGLLAAFLSIISLTGIISPESPTYQILDALRGAVFYYLPIFMAMSCAKRLGASPYLAVALAATLLSETINGVVGLSIFGIQLPEITYSNSFIPILIAVWFMGIVTKWVKKIVPEVLSYFLNPVLIMLITLPMTLLVFGPLGFYIGEGIIGFFTFLMDAIGPWFVMMLYSALQPFIILLGAGNFIMPVVATLLADKGFDPAFISSCTISDIAVGGAMLGYFLRARDVKQKSLFGTVTLSAILGVTEPAIYGVFVKFRRPFIAVLIGGGLGGLFAGVTGVKAYSMAWGLFGLPSYIGAEGDFKNLAFMIAAVVISFVVSAIASFMLYKPEETTEKKVEIKSNDVVRTIPIASVAQGELVQLTDIKDQAFSTGALGKGVGIIASTDDIYSPFDGEVVMVFDTKHAIGLRDENGVEVLIHIGIDTVELDGQGFDVFVSAGDKIKKGQKLAKVEFDHIKEAGYDPTVIVVVTNTNDFLDVIPSLPGNKAVSELTMNVVL